MTLHTPTHRGHCILTMVECLGVVAHFGINDRCQRLSLWYWILLCPPRLSHFHGIIYGMKHWTRNPNTWILIPSPPWMDNINLGKLFRFSRASFPQMCNGNDTLLLHVTMWKHRATWDSPGQRTSPVSRAHPAYELAHLVVFYAGFEESFSAFEWTSSHWSAHEFSVAPWRYTNESQSTFTSCVLVTNNTG